MNGLDIVKVQVTLDLRHGKLVTTLQQGNGDILTITTHNGSRMGIEKDLPAMARSQVASMLEGLVRATN